LIVRSNAEVSSGGDGWHVVARLAHNSAPVKRRTGNSRLCSAEAGVLVSRA
jgi:hypothetical protein